MKKILGFAFAATLLASSAHAQGLGYSFRAGNQTFYRGPNGLSGYQLDAGNQSFYRFNNGFSGHSLRAGNQTFYFDDYSAPKPQSAPAQRYSSANSYLQHLRGR